MIPVFFNQKQSVNQKKSFSPSSGKPEKVVSFWQEKAHPIEIMDFKPVTAKDLCLVHDKDYVESVLTGKRPNGFGNTDPEVAKALLWVSGSMVAASEFAFKKQVSTFSPTSGAHHARYSSGGGFCTFNFLVLAAKILNQMGAKKVGILDFDQHFGDGTEDIINHLNLNFITHYSFGKYSVTPSMADQYLNELPKTLERFSECEVLIYNAGADPHINDPLGGSLTTEQMYQRDKIIYSLARAQNAPIITSLAGGYQRDKSGGITPVLELHNNTMRAWRQVFERKTFD